MQQKSKLTKINNNTIYVVTLFIIQIVSIYMLAIHKYWCDETQIWQLAKYNDIIGLYKACKPEGHPMLYSIIVKFIQLFSSDVISLSILNTIADIAAVAILFFKINGKKWQKILLSLGIQLCYFNAVNGRPYGLFTLIIVLVFATYQTRDEHPYRYYFSLMLLQQTHIYLWQFIGILWIFGVIDTYKIIKLHGIKQRKSKDNIIGMLLYSIGIIWLLVQLLGIGQDASSNSTLIIQESMGSSGFVSQLLLSVVLQIICPLYMISMLSYQSLVSGLQLLMIEKYGVGLSHSMSDFADSTFMIVQIAAFILLISYIQKMNSRLGILAYIQVLGQSLLSSVIFGALPNRLALTFLILGITFIMQDVNVEKNSNKVYKLYKFGYTVIAQMSILFNIGYILMDISYGYGLGYVGLQSIQDVQTVDQTVVLIDKRNTYQDIQLIQYWSGNPVVMLNDLQEYRYADFSNNVKSVVNMQNAEIISNAEYILDKYRDVKFIFIDLYNSGVPDNLQKLFYVNDITDDSNHIRNINYCEYSVYELKLKN